MTVTPRLVTLMVAVPERPAESVTVTAQGPAATDVTVKVAVGPVPVGGDTVAIPLHVFDSVSVPL